MKVNVDVLTLSGTVFTVRVEDDCSVWHLKREIEKVTTTSAYLQRLIGCDGMVLPDGQLSNFCPLGDGELQITMVSVPKSQSEMDWFNHWSTHAPEWLQRSSHKLLDGGELHDYQQHAELEPKTFRVPRWLRFRGGSSAHGPDHHPTRVVKSPMEMPVQPKRLRLTTSEEVIRAIKRAGPFFRSVCISGSEVELSFGKPHSAEVELLASCEAVATAIAEAPDVVLDPLICSPDVAFEKIVELVVRRLQLWCFGMTARGAA
eukprot:TRINITY_DN8275_c0_g1_i4.p1 TRINITY_DN8275_c0_g1~~TRINITY_DN8275_c0_g1_i4.p1  ORF type:complete len:283 (+),score=29.77 TRINITY_DN8275_c0_g1_i4:70-849(+)